MLGLFNSIIRSMGLVVIPGGLLEDGDWVKMTSVDWADQDGVNWTSWENTSDGE